MKLLEDQLTSLNMETLQCIHANLHGNKGSQLRKAELIVAVASVELSSLYVPTLQKIASFLDIRGRSTLNKDALVSVIAECLGAKRNPVPPGMLQYLRQDYLIGFATGLGLSASGTKADLSKRLHGHIMYEDLSKENLKLCCRALELPVSGNKSDLLYRLIPEERDAAADAAEDDHTTKNSSTRAKGSAKIGSQPMTTKEYRKRLKELDLLEDDQDVFHIIAHSNGGAEHTDNYHYAQNKSFNRQIGNRFDALNCYLAGKEKASKAVAISRIFGTYNGPDADKLYVKGEAFFRDARKQKRDAYKQ